MRINIVAVGRLKETYFSQAVSEYAKRMGAYCDFSVIEVSAAPLQNRPRNKNLSRRKNLQKRQKVLLLQWTAGAKNCPVPRLPL